MDKIQLRRGTTAEWAAANPILADGEPGLDTDTREVKHGDGVTAWSVLPAAGGGGGGGAGPWVTRLGASPMADLTGWEVKAGTWAPSAYGVLGSGTAVGDYLTFETDVAQSSIAMEAILRFESLSTAGGWHGSGFAFWANDAVLAAGTLQVLYRTDGSVIVDHNNSSAGTPTLPGGTLPSVAANTDIRFGAILRGNSLDLYTDGVYRASAVVTLPSAASVRRRTGLVTRAKNTHFRGVSIWTPATPW